MLGYTVLMAKPTGEELSKLYPTPKTYEERQADLREIQEIRRPKFVELKIGIWTALFIPIVVVVCRIVVGIAATFQPGTGTVVVLSGVSGAFLSIAAGFGTLYYLWWLIDSVASKVIVDPSRLYASLGGIIFATLGLCLYILRYEFSLFQTTTGVTLLTFVAAFWVTRSVLKKQS